MLAGANGAAGEIGYALRGPADETGAADGRAPLEEFVGGRAIGERGSRLLGATVSAADVFASDNAATRALIDETLAELATHVANLVIALDPARVAVGGGLMSHGKLVLAALRAPPAPRGALPGPSCVPAAFVHDGSLRGALALGLEVADTTANEALR